MKTIQDYHEAVDKILEGLLSGSIKPPVAVEANNAIGKKIALMRLQLDYDHSRSKLGALATVIPQLEGTKATP